MIDKFQPMLYPNDAVDVSVINRPMMASYKLDGIRCIFTPDGRMLSRSFKPIQNVRLQKKFDYLKVYCKENNTYLDGEIYGHGMTFQEITHFVMTKDTGFEEIPEALQFNAFDVITDDNLNDKAIDRYNILKDIKSRIFTCKPDLHVVAQQLVETPGSIENLMANALDDGYEGLILKAPDSPYKAGRVTTRSGMGYKFKPYQTWDATIIDVEQGTKVKDNVARTFDSWGYSQTSGKKGDRELVDKACAVKVLYEGKELWVSLAMPDEQKQEVWLNRDKYIGKSIEYKGMLVGAKDVPRHPVFLRFIGDDKQSPL